MNNIIKNIDYRKLNELLLNDKVINQLINIKINLYNTATSFKFILSDDKYVIKYNEKLENQIILIDEQINHQRIKITNNFIY